MPAADDVSARRIVLAGAGIAAVVAIAVTVVVVELRAWGVPLDGDRGADRRVAIPGAELQVAPQPDLQRYRDEKQRLLDATAWADAASGVARIPIEQAMALLSERGLRAAPAAQDGR